MSPPDFIRHRMLGFSELIRFEILVLLHELNIIDWLSEVNPPAADRGLIPRPLGSLKFSD